MCYSKATGADLNLFGRVPIMNFTNSRRSVSSMVLLFRDNSPFIHKVSLTLRRAI